MLSSSAQTGKNPDKDMTEREPITLEDGTQAFKYPDGSIRRRDGRFLRQPPWAAPTITEETAPALAQRRHEKAQKRVRDRLYERAKNGIYPDARDPADAYAMSVTDLWEDAATVRDAPMRDRAAVLKFTGDAGGWRLARGERNAPMVAIQVNVSDELARRYLGDAVDGEAVDSSDDG